MNTQHNPCIMKNYPEDKLKQLLLHDEEVNTTIGLHILSSLPSKEEYLTYLFALAYYHPNEVIKTEAHAQFKAVAHRKLISYVDSMFAKLKVFRFKEDMPPKAEQKLNEHLTKIAAFPNMHAEELGNLTLFFKGQGVLFCQKQGVSLWQTTFSKVIRLDLSKIYASEMAPMFSCFPELTWLDLSANQLDKIPDEIGHLSRLEEINLSNNLLTDCKLLTLIPGLTYINLSKNRLGELPEAIGQLRYLYTIDTSQNLLKDLPQSLKNSSKVPNIVLPNNHIEFWNASLYDYMLDTQGALNESPHTAAFFSNHQETQLPGNLPNPEIWTDDDGYTYLSYPWMDWGEWTCECLPLMDSFFVKEDHFYDVLLYRNRNYEAICQLRQTEQVLEDFERANTSDALEVITGLLADNTLSDKEKAGFWQDWFTLPTVSDWQITNDGYDYRTDTFNRQKVQIPASWWSGEAMDGLMLEALQLQQQQASYSDQHLLQYYLDDDIADYLLAETRVNPEALALMTENGLWIGEQVMQVFPAMDFEDDYWEM